MNAIIIIVAIAAALLFLMLLRISRDPVRRRTNHKYIPACYSQSGPEIQNQKSEIGNQE